MQNPEERLHIWAKNMHQLFHNLVLFVYIIDTYSIFVSRGIISATENHDFPTSNTAHYTIKCTLRKALPSAPQVYMLKYASLF